MNRIKCGHCSTSTSSVYHGNIAAVRHCARANSLAVAARNTRVPVQQPVQPPRARTNEWSFKAPEQMVRDIREGRYAVRPDSETPYTFLRCLRPTRGRRRGSFVIDTQHSDEFKLAIIFTPDGKLWINPQRSAASMAILDTALILVAVDPITGVRNYGRELGRCGRCGKQLTDERSRWYAIGPECEKHFPELIDEIDEEQNGPFYLGKVWADAS